MFLWTHEQFRDELKHVAMNQFQVCTKFSKIIFNVFSIAIFPIFFCLEFILVVSARSWKLLWWTVWALAHSECVASSNYRSRYCSREHLSGIATTWRCHCIGVLRNPRCWKNVNIEFNSREFPMASEHSTVHLVISFISRETTEVFTAID